MLSSINVINIFHFLSFPNITSVIYYPVNNGNGNMALSLHSSPPMPELMQHTSSMLPDKKSYLSPSSISLGKRITLFLTYRKERMGTKSKETI